MGGLADPEGFFLDFRGGINDPIGLMGTKVRSIEKQMTCSMVELAWAPEINYLPGKMEGHGDCSLHGGLVNQ